MTDQGWGSADGSARGTATGAKGGSDDVRDADARKVVPFPREWYGSPDELVPIDLGPPEADAADAAGSAATEAAAFWEGDVGTERELADPADARRRDPATSRSPYKPSPLAPVIVPVLPSHLQDAPRDDGWQLLRCSRSYSRVWRPCSSPDSALSMPPIRALALSGRTRRVR